MNGLFRCLCASGKHCQREEAAQFVRENRATATNKGYEQHKEQYKKWCNETGRQWQQASQENLVTYIIQQYKQKQWSASYCSSARSAISDIYKFNGGEKLGESEMLRAVMDTIKKTAKPEKQKEPLRIHHYREMFKVIDMQCFRDVRDYYMWLLMFSIARRAGEAVRIETRDVEIDEEKQLARITYTPAKKRRRVRKVAIVKFATNNPELNIRLWHETYTNMRKNKTAEKLFTSTEGKQLSASTPLHSLRRLLSRTSIDGKQFGGQSARRGAATTMAETGASYLEIKEHGDWSSEAVMRYIRTAEEQREPATRYLNNIETERKNDKTTTEKNKTEQTDSSEEEDSAEEEEEDEEEEEEAEKEKQADKKRRRERERRRERRETSRGKEKQSEESRNRQQREKEQEKQGDRERERKEKSEKQAEREGETEKGKEREKEREREQETEKGKERQREKERIAEKEPEKISERGNEQQTEKERAKEGKIAESEENREAAAGSKGENETEREQTAIFANPYLQGAWIRLHNQKSERRRKESKDPNYYEDRRQRRETERKYEEERELAARMKERKDRDEREKEREEREEEREKEMEKQRQAEIKQRKEEQEKKEKEAKEQKERAKHQEEEAEKNKQKEKEQRQKKKTAERKRKQDDRDKEEQERNEKQKQQQSQSLGRGRREKKKKNRDE